MVGNDSVGSVIRNELAGNTGYGSRIEWCSVNEFGSVMMIDKSCIVGYQEIEPEKKKNKISGAGEKQLGFYIRSRRGFMSAWH